MYFCLKFLNSLYSFFELDNLLVLFLFQFSLYFLVFDWNFIIWREFNLVDFASLNEFSDYFLYFNLLVLLCNFFHKLTNFNRFLSLSLVFFDNLFFEAENLFSFDNIESRPYLQSICICFNSLVNVFQIVLPLKQFRRINNFMKLEMLNELFSYYSFDQFSKYFRLDKFNRLTKILFFKQFNILGIDLKLVRITMLKNRVRILQSNRVMII